MSILEKVKFIKNISIFLIMFILTVIALILLIWHRVFITVEAGEAGVLFKRWSGTVIDRVYSEGFWIIFPWDKLTRYNLRIQEIKHDFAVLSKQGLTIDIKISIRFRPDSNMVSILHQKIGPNYITSVVIPEVEAVIRRFFGQFNDEEIYTSKKAILEKIINDSREELSDKFIILDDLIVRKIEFPKTVQDSIQSKITQYHKFKEYEYRIEREKLEAERKVIEANGIDKYKRIISKDLTDNYLRWKGIEATNNLAISDNSKVVIIGAGKDGLPLILNPDTK